MICISVISVFYLLTHLIHNHRIKRKYGWVAPGGQSRVPARPDRRPLLCLWVSLPPEVPRALDRGAREERKKCRFEAACNHFLSLRSKSYRLEKRDRHERDAKSQIEVRRSANDQ